MGPELSRRAKSALVRSGCEESESLPSLCNVMAAHDPRMVMS